MSAQTRRWSTWAVALALLAAGPGRGRGESVAPLTMTLGPVPQNVEPDLSLSDLQEELRELETVAKQDIGRSPTPDAQSSRSRECGLATKRGAC